eukprot:522-Heterococcus_DN1.PRE.1
MQHQLQQQVVSCCSKSTLTVLHCISSSCLCTGRVLHCHVVVVVQVHAHLLAYTSTCIAAVLVFHSGMQQALSALATCSAGARPVHEQTPTAAAAAMACTCTPRYSPVLLRPPDPPSYAPIHAA